MKQKCICIHVFSKYTMELTGHVYRKPFFRQKNQFVKESSEQYFIYSFSVERISGQSTCITNYPLATVPTREKEQKGSSPCYSSFRQGTWTSDSERSARTPGLQWEALWGGHLEWDCTFLQLPCLALPSHPQPSPNNAWWSWIFPGMCVGI